MATSRKPSGTSLRGRPRAAAAAVARRLRRRLHPASAAVLAYHRVAELELDPWGLAVAPARFREQLQALGRAFPLAPLAAILAGTAPRGAVAVTFDDGYADALTEAKPLLEEQGVPAAVFVVTGALDATSEFWWDALERIFLLPGRLPPELRLGLPDGERRWHLADDAEYGRRAYERHRGWRRKKPPPTQRHVAFLDVWTALKLLPAREQRRCITLLEDWSGTGPGIRTSHRTLTRDETRRLAAGALVEVGAHTVTHPSLPCRPPEERHRELSGSRSTLTELLGEPPAGLSYPYGDHDRATQELARRAGFAYACTSASGGLWRPYERYAVPRVPVFDVPGDVLVEEVRRATGRQAPTLRRRLAPPARPEEP